jgi:hypothetical protein
MKLLTNEEIKSLPYGEKVTRISNGRSVRLVFVGRVPGNENSVVFMNGGKSEVMPLHYGENKTIYSGPYDSNFVGEILISNLEKEIAEIKEVYMDALLTQLEK